MEITPAVVREDREMVAQEWHEQAVSSAKSRDVSMLTHAEAIYQLSQKERFKELGFSSIQEYVGVTFEKSSQTTDKLLQVYRTYVVDLKQDPETLADVGWGKLSMMAGAVNEENVEDTLKEMADMTQKEISAKIKESKGLEENETEVSPGIVSIRIKAPEEAAEVIQMAAKMAKEEYAEETNKEARDVLEFQAYELMAANYMATADLGGDPEETLKTIIRKMESVHSIEISYKRVQREN